MEVSFGVDLDGNGVLGLNQPPVATAGAYTTQENQSIALNLANLATDSNNDVLTFSSTSGPLKGTVSLDSAGSGTYTPTGFDSLPAGTQGADSFTYSVTDGKSPAVTNNVNLTITGANDSATITANTFDSNAAGDSASVISFSESQVVDGRTGTDVFSVSDVDFGEEEFSAGSFKQTVQILADGKGSLQDLSSSANRTVGTYSLDASAATNAIDAGATTGRTADLNILDSGGATGFASLAAGEIATASITLVSEDGTATAVSNLTITGANDPSGITSTAFKLNYTQSDFAVSPVVTYADSYKVNDIDYGEQEFSSGKYNTSILIDSTSGRSGQAVGSFSIVSDGSNRNSGNVSRDAGSTNSDSADVVIAADGIVPVGQVFNLAAVLDDISGNSYGVQLKIPDNLNTATVNESKGGNYYYDLSDLTLGSTANGQIEVYRYKTDGDGNIIGGGWTASDSNLLSPSDPLRLIGGINSLAYGETATATLAGVSSEDGTSSSGPTTIKIVGVNDAPIIDSSRKLNSFELYGTFTVAQMLGFVDPNKTLITDVDYGSMPESIAVTKLTPTGGFADADTGVLQRYNETTKEWEDIDTKNVSDAHKLLLRPSDLLRFNASAEAYVSAALDKGSSEGGVIFDVEFRAWDSSYESALQKDNAIGDSTLFSGGLQTISLAIATSGERANETDLTYIPGQAIGINGANITVDGELNIQTPVKGGVAGAGSSVNDNAVALVDGTSFGGIHGVGVGKANNIASAGNAFINAQAEGYVTVDASYYFDSFDDATDADATARLGIKSGPKGSGLVANGAYGVRDVDLEIGGNLGTPEKANGTLD